MEVQGHAELPRNTSAVQPASSHSELAPYYPVPACRLVSVEHPFDIRNVARAIESLGGSKGVGKAISNEHSETEEMALYLHPGQRGSNSVLSGNTSTKNISFRVSVPRPTGRKRKRGTSDPFEEIKETHGNSQSNGIRSSALSSKDKLLRALHDNPGQIHCQSVGIIERTHRFRTMPDFVFSVENNPFMARIRDCIEPLNYHAAKNFSFDLTRRTEPHSDLIPPPTFSDQVLPFNYSYRQNPAVVEIVDKSGNTIARNKNKTFRNKILSIPYNGARAPAEPPTDLQPIGLCADEVQALFGKIQALFDERPIWTRRALGNRVGKLGSSEEMKFVYPYLGYEFTSGPWQNTLVRYGIDPRDDRQYRIYQTMTFQFADAEMKPNNSDAHPRARESTVNRFATDNRPHDSMATSHVFDGASVDITTGKSFQVCDISDRTLQKLLATEVLRKKCHTKVDGWYHNGTWAKARVILKHKICALLTPGTGLMQLDFDQIAILPEIFLQQKDTGPYLEKTDASPLARSLTQRARAIASAPENLGGIDAP